MQGNRQNDSVGGSRQGGATAPPPSYFAGIGSNNLQPLSWICISHHISKIIKIWNARSQDKHLAIARTSYQEESHGPTDVERQRYWVLFLLNSAKGWPASIGRRLWTDSNQNQRGKRHQRIRPSASTRQRANTIFSIMKTWRSSVIPRLTKISFTIKDWRNLSH